MENARQFLWMQGEFTGLAHPVWAQPVRLFLARAPRAPSWSSPPAARTNPRRRQTFEQQMEDLHDHRRHAEAVIAASCACIMQETRPGIMAFWGNDGFVSQAGRMTCIRLLGQEVMPAMREMAKELDLKSPFEANTPVSASVLDRPEAAGDGGGAGPPPQGRKAQDWRLAVQPVSADPRAAVSAM